MDLNEFNIHKILRNLASLLHIAEPYCRPTQTKQIRFYIENSRNVGGQEKIPTSPRE
jgi:hypothetical protein